MLSLNLFFLGFRPILFLFGLSFQLLQFPFIGGNLFLFFFDGSLAAFQIGQEIFEGNILFTQTFSGIFDNIIRKSEFAGMAKALLLPGMPTSRR